MKAYVGDGVGRGLLPRGRAVPGRRDPGAGAGRARGHRALARSWWRPIREAIAADPRVAGRLALWGRRLMGEMLSQAQRTAAERDALSNLLVGGIGGGTALPGLRPRRDRPDVRPAHRGAHPPDAGARPVRLTGRGRPSVRRRAQSAPKPTRRSPCSPISTYASLSAGTITWRPFSSARMRMPPSASAAFDCGDDLFGRQGALQRQLARGALDADLDLHGTLRWLVRTRSSVTERPPRDGRRFTPGVSRRRRGGTSRRRLLSRSPAGTARCPATRASPPAVPPRPAGSASPVVHPVPRGHLGGPDEPDREQVRLAPRTARRPRRSRR